ncbi:hypothetical protein LINGRAHAP2_LOCUS32240 [Linum grandiflorum]
MMRGQWRWKAIEIPYNSREDIGTKFCPERPESCKKAAARRAEHMARAWRNFCQPRIFSGSPTARRAGSRHGVPCVLHAVQEGKFGNLFPFPKQNSAIIQNRNESPRDIF